ncbi:MAG: nucleotidyltransferase domain-containing protein [bacterium]|nr:nucleotidyltransferase domain-containing protein [bacterium]
MINILKSKLRAKLLAFYFTHPDAELYLSELARAIKADPMNLSRELSRLEKDNIFISRISGKQKYYKLNINYLFYKELKNITAKTVGVESSLAEVLKGEPAIKFCFIFGSYATGADKADSDIDLFVIGELSAVDLIAEKISGLEKKIGREINYRFFSEVDLKKALKEKNSFILNIIKNKKVFLIGHEKDFRKFN